MLMFKEGFFYLSDSAGHISGPYISKSKATDAAVEGDYLLQIHYLDTHKKKIQKITLDFNTKQIIIDSAKPLEVTLNKVVYSTGTTDMDTVDNWYELLTDSYKACNNIEVVGVPPVEGERLL